MLGGSLFERLSGEFDTLHMDEDEILYNSIANNLANILSTNTGNSQTVPNYGKVDLNNIDLNPKHSQRFIEKSLEKSISMYEKRLNNCKITVMPNQRDVSTMNIYVDGDMRVKGTNFKETFNARVYGDGRIRLLK